MCLIIIKPKNIRISSISQLIENASINNPDGLGYWTQETGVIKNKESDTDQLLKIDSFAIIHFRFATQGSVSLENCHPFQIKGDYVLFHNGTLPLQDTKRDITDSQILAEALSKSDKSVWRDILKIASVSNRFVILNTQTGVFEKFGDWHKRYGCQLSNLGCSNEKMNRNYYDYWDNYGADNLTYKPAKYVKKYNVVQKTIDVVPCQDWRKGSYYSTDYMQTFKKVLIIPRNTKKRVIQGFDACGSSVTLNVWD